jgi:hypothetical protein
MCLGLVQARFQLLGHIGQVFMSTGPLCAWKKLNFYLVSFYHVPGLAYPAVTRFIPGPKIGQLAGVVAWTIMRKDPDKDANPVLTQRFSRWNEREMQGRVLRGPQQFIAEQSVAMPQIEKQIGAFFLAEPQHKAKGIDSLADQSGANHSEEVRACPGFDQSQEANFLALRVELLGHLKGK